MDEIGHTATAFNALLARVAEVVGEVRRSAGSVSVASRQIASGQHRSVATHRRTSRVAGGNRLEHGRADRDGASERGQRQQATTLATTASGIAQRGGEVVGRVVETMHGISDSSAKVAEIITRDRGHRVPDQHPGAQRGGRGGARRRTGARLCGRGGRGAHARATQCDGGQGNQGADRRVGESGGRPARSSSRKRAARSTKSSSR